MTEGREGQVGRPGPEELAAMVNPGCPFGPAFFLTQLRGFVRERCPDPKERLPVVHLHLGDGEVLDVCHVIGIAPRWLALAVRDPEAQGHAGAMRTELVPYETVYRVTIRAVRPAETHLGFDHGRTPPVFADARPRSPEETLRAAATAKAGAAGKAATGGREGKG